MVNSITLPLSGGILDSLIAVFSIGLALIGFRIQEQPYLALDRKFIGISACSPYEVI